MSRLLYAERQGDNPPSKVNAGAVWLEYSQDKNAQAVSGCAQLRVIPTTPPPDRGAAAWYRRKAKLAGDAGHLGV